MFRPQNDHFEIFKTNKNIQLIAFFEIPMQPNILDWVKHTFLWYYNNYFPCQSTFIFNVQSVGIVKNTNFGSFLKKVKKSLKIVNICEIEKNGAAIFL